MRRSSFIQTLVQLMAEIAGATRSKRLDVDELPEHLKRDIGLAEGCQPAGGITEGDPRATTLGQLTLPRFAS